MRVPLLTTAIVAICATTSTAGAVTLISVDGSEAAFANSATGAQYTFEPGTGDPVGFKRTGGFVRSGTLTGTTSRIFGAPLENNHLYVTQNSTATIAATAGYQVISFYIGSIDVGNRVDILDTNGAVIKSYFGADLSSSGIANGAAVSPITNRLLTFTAEGNELLTGLTLFSNVNSLEADNIRFTGVIPEPTTWAMMLLGFTMVGAASRYRRRSIFIQYS